jgi:hypothetical protein
MLRLALVAVCIALTGCSFTTRHGDAKVRHLDARLAGKGRSKILTIPEFSISEAGVHRFTVAEISEPMYPDTLFVRVPDDDSRALGGGIDPPWVGSLLSMELKDSAGLTFCEVALQLTTPHSFSHRSRRSPVRTSPNSWYEAHYSLFESPNSKRPAPRHSYEVVIHVKTPSPRAGDVARLEGTLHVDLPRRPYPSEDGVVVPGT